MNAVGRAIGPAQESHRTHRSHEEHERHDEHRRIQHVRLLVALPEHFELGVPRLRHDFFVEVVARCEPDISVGAGKGPFIGEAKACLGSAEGSQCGRCRGRYLGQLQPLVGQWSDNGRMGQGYVPKHNLHACGGINR